MNDQKRFGMIAAVGIVMLAAGCESGPAGHRSGADSGSDCPQPRFTGKAPEPWYSRNNPLEESGANIAAGRELYQHETAPVACSQCHGRFGDGLGPMSHMFDPPPRNFTCEQTISGVPDGQLFWIIRNGSPGTSMPAFDELDDEEIWQIVLYIRSLSNGHS